LGLRNMNIFLKRRNTTLLLFIVAFNFMLLCAFGVSPEDNLCAISSAFKRVLKEVTKDESICVQASLGAFFYKNREVFNYQPDIKGTFKALALDLAGDVYPFVSYSQFIEFLIKKIKQIPLDLYLKTGSFYVFKKSRAPVTVYNIFKSSIKFKDTELTYYPEVKAGNILRVTIKFYFKRKDVDLSIKIYDTFGKLVGSQNINFLKKYLKENFSYEIPAGIKISYLANPGAGKIVINKKEFAIFIFHR